MVACPSASRQRSRSTTSSVPICRRPQRSGVKVKRACGPSAAVAPTGPISWPGCSVQRTVQSCCPSMTTLRAISSPSKPRRELGRARTVMRGGRRWARPAASSSSAGAATPANSGRRATVAMNTPNKPSVSSRRACRDDRQCSASSVGPTRSSRSFGPAGDRHQPMTAGAWSRLLARAAGSVFGVGTAESNLATTSSEETWRTHSSGRSVTRCASAGTATCLMSSGTT